MWIDRGGVIAIAERGNLHRRESSWPGSRAHGMRIGCRRIIQFHGTGRNPFDHDLDSDRSNRGYFLVNLAKAKAGKKFSCRTEYKLRF